jgi:CRP-like cAMP-binding protein
MSADKRGGTSEIRSQRQELYKDRWTSYGANTGILEISERLSASELKKYEIFSSYDDKFLERISPDVSVAKWKKDAILFEEGTYLNLAFFVASGAVKVYLRKQQEQSVLSQPRFDASRTMIFEKTLILEAEPKTRQIKKEALPPAPKPAKPANGITFLSSMDFNLPNASAQTLGAGEIFGEIGAMSGWPQSVTARTAAECELVQIRVAALRLMKQKSKAFKERIDKIYRERALFSQLKSTPLFKECDDAFIEALAQKVELVSCEPDEAITRESESAEAFYLVRSGFVRLAQQLGEGQVIVTYLSKGMTLGEIELLIEGIKGWECTATSVEYTDLVKINRNDFHEIIKKYPDIEKQLWLATVNRIKETGRNSRDLKQSEFIETALQNGLVQGNSILVIDLEVCTRCDECVRACADTHGGLPRFVREGEKYENLMITRACYHCRDPVCLVGCPTGAIHRTNVGDVVAIDDHLCIGCQNCANKCPYDAITMRKTGELWPANALAPIVPNTERLLATKCDLCYNTGHGPACVSNCPHGCAMRVGSLDEFQQLLSKGA